MTTSSWFGRARRLVWLPLICGLLHCTSLDEGPAERTAGTDGAEGPDHDGTLGGQTGDGDGPSDGCSAQIWTAPDAERRTERCQRDDAQTDGARAYGCSCDLAACALPSPFSGELLPDCAKRSSAADCAGALVSACEHSPGYYGFCEGTVQATGKVFPCFDRSDGTYQCSCPDQGEPVIATALDCWLALNACSPSCTSEAGHCEADSKGYQCSCADGRSEPAVGTWCADVLEETCGSPK